MLTHWVGRGVVKHLRRELKPSCVLDARFRSQVCISTNQVTRNEHSIDTKKSVPSRVTQ